MALRQAQDERGRYSERGAALLTVLLLVAVIAVMAGTALERLRLSTRLAQNIVSIDQARAYALAGEALALSRISNLLSQNHDRTTLAGGWSGRPFPLPVPDGLATITVQDGGNCFNLNSLVTQTAPGTYAAYTPARLQFARLIRLVGAPASSPDNLAAAVSDWIDSDRDPLPGGAEDSAYQALPTPYRTANTLIADASELRAVSGVTPAVYDRLRPWVCALPRAEPSRINVNTLTPEQGALMAMLFPDTLSIGAARELLLRRPPQGYESSAAFFAAPALSGITAAPDAVQQTAVTSQWFALDIRVTQGASELEEHALVDATRLPARLASRHWGEPS